MDLQQAGRSERAGSFVVFDENSTKNEKSFIYNVILCTYNEIKNSKNGEIKWENLKV